MASAFFKEYSLIFFFYISVHVNDLELVFFLVVFFFLKHSGIYQMSENDPNNTNIAIIIHYFSQKETTTFPFQCHKYVRHYHYSLQTSTAGTCSRAQDFRVQLQILSIAISVIDSGAKKEEKGQKMQRQYENN